MGINFNDFSWNLLGPIFIEKRAKGDRISWFEALQIFHENQFSRIFQKNVVYNELNSFFMGLHGSGGQRNAHSHNFKPLKIVGNYSENEKIIKQMGTVSLLKTLEGHPVHNNLISKRTNRGSMDDTLWTDVTVTTSSHLPIHRHTQCKHSFEILRRGIIWDHLKF